MFNTLEYSKTNNKPWVLLIRSTLISRNVSNSASGSETLYFCIGFLVRLYNMLTRFFFYCSLDPRGYAINSERRARAGQYETVSAGDQTLAPAQLSKGRWSSTSWPLSRELVIGHCDAFFLRRSCFPRALFQSVPGLVGTVSSSSY